MQGLPTSSGLPLELIITVLAILIVALASWAVIWKAKGRGGPSNETNNTGVQVNGESIMNDVQLQNVVVKDIKMSFGSMVVFMIKWVLAAIPAMIILSLIGLAIGAIAGGMFGGFLG